jgi:hypothetical protein
MTTDTRTPAEIAYDNQRSGAAYVRQSDEGDQAAAYSEQFAAGVRDGLAIGQAIKNGEYTPLSPAWEAILDITDDSTNNGRAHAPEPVPFGELADGTPIMGQFDDIPDRGPWERWGVVSADVGECSVTADDSGSFSFNIGEHGIEGATLAELVAFRAVLNSGAFERLYAASVAWGRGDTEPPTLANEPQRVRAERHICPDTLDRALYGKEVGTRYFCGEGDAMVEVYIPDGRQYSEICLLGGYSDSIDLVRRTLPNIVALLADPRIIAALEAA